MKILPKRSAYFRGHAKIRKTLFWFAGALISIGVLGALVAPPLVRYKLTSELSEALHRQVSIRQVRINPYTMSATIRGLLMKEPEGEAVVASFDELFVNLEASSLFHRGIVMKEVRLVKPYINLIRNEDLTYNVSDLMGGSKKGPAGRVPRFSFNNIQIVDGRIDFDDRPEGASHTVTSIQIGIPFISSLRYYADVKVEPVFSALVDGAPVEIQGETKPFKDSRETSVHLDINDLKVPKYIDYLPVERNFNVSSGQVDGKLSVSFKIFKNKPSLLVISGRLGLTDLALQEKDDTPILKLPSFEVIIDSFEAFARRASFKAIRAHRPELHVTRDQDGSFTLMPLIASRPGKSEERRNKTASFGYRVEEISLDGGTLHFNDWSLTRPFQKRFDDFDISVKGLTNEPGEKASVDISFRSDVKEQFSQSGTLQISPFMVDGMIGIKGLQLSAFRPYYESLVALEVRRGLADLTAHTVVERQGELLNTKLSQMDAVFKSLVLHISGEPEPLWRIPQLLVKDINVDLSQRTVTIGALESRDGSGFVKREADGGINHARVVKEQPGRKQGAKLGREAGWRFEARRILLDRFRVVFEDRSLGTAAKIAVSELSAHGGSFSNVKNTRGKIAVRGKINERGSLGLIGSVGINPPRAKLAVEAQGIEVLPFQPYLSQYVNFLLTGGKVGTKANVTVEPGRDGSLKVGAQGDLQVTDFGSVEKNSAEDLLRWSSLDLAGVQLQTDPPQVRVTEITLADFFSRLIIGSDGRIKLQNLVAPGGTERGAQNSIADGKARATAGTESAASRVTIEKINLVAGRVHFSDFFINPPYSLTLTEIQGGVVGLKPETAGDLQIQAKLDNTAHVDMSGKINPMAKDLYLDIKAKARDIELSPLTPYSGKYIGYGIDKGKLSLDLQYHLENRKLSAENKLTLNQLTFGRKVESPDAIKLPVLLAVSLLKDRQGVIDVELPISGSLDDPQFSVGGIILKVIANIIVKAVTSPFAFLSSVFGGGEELSYIEFDHGTARLTQAARTRLETLSKALNDRPALRLEISGRVDPVNDRERLRAIQVERKVKAQKMKELVSKGTAPPSNDDVRIQDDEYAGYLTEAYRAENFPKPRNFLGLSRKLPVAEMEKLMLQHSEVTDAQLRQLATERAQAVRDYLLAVGRVNADRLFIVAPSFAGERAKNKPKAKASRVDLSLR